MEIRLKKMEIQNFKGLRSFLFSPEGGNATIRGDNATGKTTVADAFRWLLFGKDTQDSASFQLKTLDSEGQPLHNIDHAVTGLIDIDGTSIELKRVYKEKWTKKRGEAHKALTGHTTDYFIDGVPVQQKKWDSRLSDIIDENIFKLVTLPGYFNSLHWQKRRDILLDVCGDITNTDVIASNRELEAIPTIIRDRTIDDHRKVVQAEKRTINDRLREIPARIDELTNSLPAETINRKAIEAHITHINDKIREAQDDSVLSGHRKDLADTRAYLAEFQAADMAKNREANQKTEAKTDLLKSEIRELNTRIADMKSDNESRAYTARKNNEIMDDLRTQYAQIMAQQPQYKEICPTCNQPMPADQIDAAKARFQENQATELAEINTKGKELKAENETTAKQIGEVESAIRVIEKEILELEKSLEQIAAGRVEIAPNDKIPEILKEIDKLETLIKDHPTPDISAYEAERQEEQAKLAALDAAEKTRERIEELKTEEKQLAAKFEELESQLFLMEKFIVQKVNLLEDKINSKFKLVRFKLFDVQINEGIKETCVTTVNGVPWDSVNDGAKIEAGCDISKTLQEHYGIKAPIWIDHRESWTGTPDLDCQTIFLMVDPEKDEMEVEYAKS